MVLKIINLKIDNINERGQDIKKRLNFCFRTLECGIIVRLPSEKVHETVKSLALEFRRNLNAR